MAVCRLSLIYYSIRFICLSLSVVGLSTCLPVRPHDRIFPIIGYELFILPEVFPRGAEWLADDPFHSRAWQGARQDTEVRVKGEGARMGKGRGQGWEREAAGEQRREKKGVGKRG